MCKPHEQVPCSTINDAFMSDCHVLRTLVQVVYLIAFLNLFTFFESYFLVARSSTNVIDSSFAESAAAQRESASNETQERAHRGSDRLNNKKKLCNLTLHNNSKFLGLPILIEHLHDISCQ